MRVALEMTVLELDRAGTARAIRGLRAALEGHVEVLDVAHPGSGGSRLLRGLDRETRWFWHGLQRAVRGADLLHLPAAVGPWRAPLPFVVTFNDVLALEHPGWFSRANALQQRLAVRRLAHGAARVIVPSTWTADRLVAVTGAARQKIRVVPYGVDPHFTPGKPDPSALARLGVDGPYVLAVGTLQPRKGLDALADACDGIDRRLVVAGARGWHDDAILARLQGNATITGRVSDEDLVTLLRGADALVYASAHEGFGYPPLEAMACGTPVVAVRRSSVPEITGGAAELAEPEGLGPALRRVLGDRGVRDELRARGVERARELTWERCAAATVDVYREALR
jgi:alpha-1,3-rhamnosyl/mannosyltransferase